MKKLIAGISALALMVGMMAGCSSTNTENTVHTKDDLVGKTIGVQLGTTGMTLAESIEGTTVEKYNKYADAIQALIQGKVDAVIIDSAPESISLRRTAKRSPLLTSRMPLRNTQ